MDTTRTPSAITMSSLRCLHVISSIDPSCGGPQEGLKQLTHYSLAAGAAVEIASLDSPGSTWGAAYGCPVHCLGPTRLGTYRYSSRVLPWLTAHAKGFDAIVVHGLWQYHGLAVWRLWRRLEVPYFVYSHGMLDPWFNKTYPFKHAKKLLYWPWAEHRVLRDARAVLFTCEEERLQARKSFRSYRVREKVVGFGIPKPVGDPASQRASFFQLQPNLNGKRMLLFLGRLHPKKGCDQLIEAFGLIARLDPELRLVMAGPDHVGMRARLIERADRLGIGERVVWPGMLSGDAKWGAFYAADAFILPSHQENFGIAVVEALACGLPVLISNKVNIWREIVRDGAGVAAEDSQEGTLELLSAWIQLDATERARMRAHAAGCFEEYFMIDAAARNLYSTMSATMVACPI